LSLAAALKRSWDRAKIRAYAESNTWDRRIPQVIAVFERVAAVDWVSTKRGAHMTAE